MKLNIFQKVVCIFIFLFLLTPAVVFGEDFEDFSGLKNTAVDNYDLEKKDIPATVGNIISYALSLLGIIFLCIIVIAYVIMSSAGGNEEEVIKAKKWIKNGVIALVMIMSAYLFVTVFIKFWSIGVFET